MARPKVMIYTEAQWAAADPIDRLYMHLLEPERWTLTQAEDEMLEQLRQVWAIICKKSTPRERIRLISEQIVVSEKTVTRYIQNAQHLFGDMLKVDMDIELALAYGRYMALYEKAKKAEDFDAARRCHDSAMLILEKIESRAPVKQKEYLGIVFTDDHSHLRSRLDAEDADFQILPDEETRLLEPEAVKVPPGN